MVLSRKLENWAPVTLDRDNAPGGWAWESHHVPIGHRAPAWFFVLWQVGKVTLHAKCASAKGGLHRYHPLIFPQPHLCMLDVALHMVSCVLRAYASSAA